MRIRSRSSRAVHENGPLATRGGTALAVSVALALSACVSPIGLPASSSALSHSDSARGEQPSTTDVPTERVAVAQHHYDQGRHWISQQRPHEAMQALDRALSADPRHVEALNARASLRAQHADLNGAMADLQTAISIDPRRSHLHFNLGLVHRMRTDEAAARIAFERALAIDPAHERARLALSAPAAHEQPRQVPAVLASQVHDSVVRIAAAEMSRLPTVEDRVRIEPSVAPLAIPSTAPEARIDIANGNGIAGLARLLRAQLAQTGVTTTTASNWVNFEQRVTRVYYRIGFESTALKVSKTLPIEVPISVLHATALGGRDVLVILGQDLKAQGLSVKREPSAAAPDGDASATLVRAPGAPASVQTL